MVDTRKKLGAAALVGLYGYKEFAERKSLKSNLFNTPAIVSDIPAIVPDIPTIDLDIPTIDPDISKMFRNDEGKKALILVSAWEADKDPSKMAALLEKLEYGLADAVFSGATLSVIETKETIVKNVRAIQETLFKPKVSNPSTAPEL